MIPSLTIKTTCPEGNLYLTIVELAILDLLVMVGKPGTEARAIGQGYGQLASLALEYGAPIERIIKALGGYSHLRTHPDRYEAKSLPDALATALQLYLREKDNETDKQQPHQ